MGKKTRRAAEVKASNPSPQDGKLRRKDYEAKLDELHMELVKMQYWIKAAGKKIVVLFEGRDAAGKASSPSATRSRSGASTSGPGTPPAAGS